MLWLDLVREYFPNAGDQELNDVLWICTGYDRFFDGDPETCARKQLSDYRDRSNGDPILACILADEDTDRWMAEAKQQEPTP